MQPSTASRKRPAPGTSPLMQTIPQQQLPVYPYSPLQDSQVDFSADFLQPIPQDQAYTDPSQMDSNGFSAFSPDAAHVSMYGGDVAIPQSTDLVRRSRNQLVGPQHAPQQEQWNIQSPNMNDRQQQQRGEEDENELTLKVQAAKRDAQGKRKQIPPFVQKLSSFLDSNNTDLIRWSDDGRSFIVLDEDEFARTLIPELFKHNNYASFVRQLNMYGFHKTVNITDGSLRQSEKARKGVKPPSMYSHPYFRKNRPDLLWLIQKPTNKPSSKRKREGSAKVNYDSDEERQYSPGPEGRPHEIGASGVGQDLTTLPRNELSAVRNELQKLQQQQRFISKMITQLKEQNDQFYRQATAFQALHDRHENSINAILTFLATFYNRSLDGTGAANLVNMFNNHQQQTQHGSVVEEFNDAPSERAAQLQRYIKKTPLLLGAPSPTAQSHSQSPTFLQPPGSAKTQPNSARHSQSPPHSSTHQEHGIASPSDRATLKTADIASPAPKEEVQTPQLQQIPESDQMMSLINSVNATNASTPNTAAPAFDFTSALDHYQNANGNAPLTPQQRDNVLALMANHHGDASSNNALVSPQPPAMPDMNQFKQTQQQLEMLTNMQRQQDDRVQELNRRLQPLSPTGSIPGLGHGSEDNPFDFTGNPGDYDPNNFFDFGSSAPDNTDIDFNFPPPADGTTNKDDDINNWDFTTNAAIDGAEMFGLPFDDDGEVALPDVTNSNVKAGDNSGRVESLSSTATSPTATVADDTGTPRKRVKRS